MLAAIEKWEIAQFLRVSRNAYATVNTLHIFGVALLIGAILPLDLRLLGAWRSIPRESMVRVLSPVAATGLTIAILAGMLLFTVDAQDYANATAMLVKLTLVAIGATAALTLHASHGALLHDASDRRLAVHAMISMTCWIGAMILGRALAYILE